MDYEDEYSCYSEEDAYEYEDDEHLDDAYDFLYDSDDSELPSAEESQEDPEDELTQAEAREAVLMELLPQPELVAADPVEENRRRLKRELRAEALTRMEESARTNTEYEDVIAEWDRLEKNQARKKQRHEFLRGDVPLEFGMKNTYDALVYPAYRMAPTERQLQRGNFLDFLADCPYEMHDLTDKGYIRSVILDMKDEHKELLYFLGIKLLSPTQVAAFRGQTDRNVRKVKATMLRRVQKRLYASLRKMTENGYSPSQRERSFLLRYEAEMMINEQTV